MTKPGAWGELTDEELFVRYRQAQKEAFLELFHRYQGRLRQYFYHRLGAALSQDREDLEQMVWLKVHSSRQEFDDQRKFAPWFFRIAFSTLVDRFRKFKLEVRPGEVENEASSDPSAQMILEWKQGLEKIKDSLNRLTPLQRESFLLCEAEGHSAEEAAEVLEIKAGAVRQNLFRARVRLQELMKEK